MQDKNAKAPKSRKQDISPVLGSIIKIASLLVIASLVVLITVIVVKVIQDRKKEEKLFGDRVEISLNDFKIITTMNDGEEVFADIQNEDVRSIVDDLYQKGIHETTDFYFFFYYEDKVSDLKKDSKEFIKNIKNLDKNLPFFVVKLTRGSEEAADPFVSYLSNAEMLQPDVLEAFDNVLGRVDSFTLIYNHEREADSPFDVKRANGQKTLVEELLKGK